MAAVSAFLIVAASDYKGTEFRDQGSSPQRQRRIGRKRTFGEFAESALSADPSLALGR
jgi:hypothetical protein